MVSEIRGATCHWYRCGSHPLLENSSQKQGVEKPHSDILKVKNKLNVCVCVRACDIFDLGGILIVIVQ